jgi:flagellar protein FlgJ
MDDYQGAFRYGNFSGLNQLKAGAARGDDQATEAAARQFEALFIQMMLSSMRKTTPGNPLFSGPGMQQYQDLMDKEMSLDLASQGGIGLANDIRRFMDPESHLPARRERILEDYQRQLLPVAPSTMEQLALRTSVSPTLVDQGQADVEVSTASTPPSNDPLPAGDPESFVRALAEPARRIGERLGVHPMALIAQAALETGWGKHLIQGDREQTNFNLFGIKARGGQASVSAETSEFRDGAMRREQAQFRWFDSLEEAFEGYAELIGDNPRYQGALAQGADPEAYARELQRAGYATDPNYADKLIGILRRPGLAASLSGVLGDSSFSLPGR